MIGKGFWQKRYLSKHTGAEIDAAVDKADKLPVLTEADEGKVLTVDDEGNIVPGEGGGGSLPEVGANKYIKSNALGTSWTTGDIERTITFENHNDVWSVPEFSSFDQLYTAITNPYIRILVNCEIYLDDELLSSISFYPSIQAQQGSAMPLVNPRVTFIVPAGSIEVDESMNVYVSLS